MSTYVFSTCVLFGQSIQTSMQNLQSPAQELSMYCSIHLCLKASRKGHLLNTQLSLVPGVPQILFTPQNIAIDQGTNSKVVPTSYDRLGHPYCRWSRSPQIYSICFSPNLSIQAAGYNHTHLDIQRRPILWGARLSWLDLSNKGYGPTSPIMKRCLYW